MNQQYLFEPIPCDKYDLLTRDEVVDLAKGYEDLLGQLQKALDEANSMALSGEQESFLLNEQLINIKNKLFGKSSEKSDKKSIDNKKKKEPRKRVRLPSERYPNLDIIEKEVTLDELPTCPCCSSQMSDSGMTEDSEYLTVIPKQYYVVRQKRHKYRCGGCQGAIVTAPAIPRIKQGGSFSDEMIIDVAISKYFDLMPIERYARNAQLGGTDLAQNSLIQLTHSLADFIAPVYESICKDVFDSEVAHADETPHKMLEGDKKSNWYLWGFNNGRSSYFDARDTRSGSVASEYLKKSKCKYLVSDVFSGYKKALREANAEREDDKILELYCNAHARRKFKESSCNFDESEFFLHCYRKIYMLQKSELKTNKKWQRLYMRAMLLKAEKLVHSLSSKSSLAKALNYFIKNFDGLVRFTTRADLPIDNNSQERELRSPVIGRKTWYGTHSKRGAKTMSILFSITQSCKLSKVNPREYLRDLIKAMHEKRPHFTPYEYSQMEESA
jgi:transposase